MRALRIAGSGLVMGIVLALHALPAGAVTYTAGEFCPLSLHGQTTQDANGRTLVCEDKGGWRWVATTSSASTTAPTTAPTTTAPPVATTTTPAPTTTSPAPTTTAAPATSPSGGALPTTGAGPAVGLLAAAGAGLVVMALALLAGVRLRRARTDLRP
ncbi:MAG TPA: hypothetical protein VKR22_04385 [Acidimicrobiales bacterium]|nr:hypothetical protein [Acidimicrobiales bacterium]